MDPSVICPVERTVEEVEEVEDISEENIKSDKQDEFFSSKVKKVLIVNIALFFGSLLIPSFWFIAVGVGVLSVVTIFIIGIIYVIKNKGYSLLGTAFLFFFIFLIVGFGTCLFNLRGV